MTNQRGSIIPVIAFLFGAAVVVTIFGYMLWPKDEEIASTSTVDTNKVVSPSNNANTSETTNGNTNATNENVNVAADATKDWKTYTNHTVGYSVKYPPQWEVADSNTQQVYINSPEKFAADSIAPDSPLYHVLIESVANDAEAAKLKDKTAITVNGVTGFQGTLEGIPHVTATFLTKFGKTIKISWRLVGAIETQQQILETFSFTDPTAGWKTYTNSTYGFSFKYPSDGYVKRDSGGSIRIQNYVPESDGYVLKSSEFYLEAGASDPSAAPAATYQTCESVVSDEQKVSFGSRTGLRGGWENQGGDAGGFRSVQACIWNNDLYFSLGVTEGNDKKTIGNQILDTLTFTK